MNLTYLLPVLLFTFGSIQNAFAQQDIIGRTSEEEILKTHRIFDIYTQRYTPDSTSVAYLKELDSPIHVVVLFGSWCHDSKKHIPEFIKVIQLAENPLLTAEYIGQSRAKSDPEGISDELHLQYTPTLIIYSGDIEIGRIVEEPTRSMEKDLVEIIKSGVAEG